MNTPRATCLALLALACAAPAAAAGDAVQTIVARGQCQMTVPANWVVDPLIKTSASAPDKSASAVLSSSRFKASLAEAKSMVQQTLKPTHTFEDGAQRLWYQYDTASQPGSSWYVGVPNKGGGICGAQISFRTAAQEALARRIALSVKPVP